MKFLFEGMTLPDSNRFYYRIYETVENSYFAELIDQTGAGFHFHRMKDEWVSDDPDRQNEAEQLGEVIDKKGL